MYDALLLSAQHQVDEIRALEKLRNEPEKEITIVGVPYWDDMKARLRPADPGILHELVAEPEVVPVRRVRRDEAVFRPWLLVHAHLVRLFGERLGERVGVHREEVRAAERPYPLVMVRDAGGERVDAGVEPRVVDLADVIAHVIEAARELPGRGIVVAERLGPAAEVQVGTITYTFIQQ